MATSKLKLAVSPTLWSAYDEYAERTGQEVSPEGLYKLTAYNSGSSDELITEYGIYSKDGKSREVLSTLPPHKDYITATEILYPLRHNVDDPFKLKVPHNDKKSFMVSVYHAGYGSSSYFYIKTKDGVVVRVTKRDNKLAAQVALIRLSKRLNPWHRALPATVMLALIVVFVSLLAYVGIITHDRSVYDAIGSIDVSPANTPNKYYTLKVGNLDEAAKNGGVTDTIFVSNSAAHWYSISNHKEYTIRAATWPSGQRITFNDTDCTIPSKRVMVYCITDAGKEYYVGIESVEPNIVDQLNAPLNSN